MRTLILAAALLTAAVPAYAQGAPKFTTATSTIKQIIANPEGKAILEKHIAPLMEYADQIGDQTLKALQPMTQGAITDETLTKIDADLAKIK
jgi:hypothetical protein